MQVPLAMFEGPEDALRAAMQALGGAKKLGPDLWPHLSPEAAARKMLDALNPERPEKLDLGQVLYVLRRAADAGVHAPFEWLAAECGYEARYSPPGERVERVAEVVATASATLAQALASLERLQRAPQRGAR